MNHSSHFRQPACQRLRQSASSAQPEPNLTRYQAPLPFSWLSYNDASKLPSHLPSPSHEPTEWECWVDLSAVHPTTRSLRIRLLGRRTPSSAQRRRALPLVPTGHLPDKRLPNDANAIGRLPGRYLASYISLAFCHAGFFVAGIGLNVRFAGGGDTIFRTFSFVSANASYISLYFCHEKNNWRVLG